MKVSGLKAIQYLYAASMWPHYRAMQNATHQPLSWQKKILEDTLKLNEDCAYGKRYKFRDLTSVKKYQATVPIVDYPQLEGELSRIAAGEQKVLTTEKVVMLERTGGSTGSNKLIPYTQGLLNQFSAATQAWQFDLFLSNRSLFGTTSYWSISPSFRGEKTTGGGVPIGFENDTDYFNPIVQFALEQCMAVPNSVKQIADWDEWKKATVRYLLSAENLGLISVWSPTFLISLMSFFFQNVESCLSELPLRRRKQIEKSGFDTAKIWPKLQLISCWTDGISAQFIPEISKLFPLVKIQGKGLLATEGVISIPLESPSRTLASGGISPAHAVTHGGVLAVTSHFLEFIDENGSQSKTLLAHELKRDGIYSPVITTRGGLYRYHIKDIVRCTGMLNQTPIIQFSSKLDRVSDLCGEKIHAQNVENALKKAAIQTQIEPSFAMLSGTLANPSYYTLFIESNEDEQRLNQFLNVTEQVLCESHHYHYARSLGQLDKLKIQNVKNGWQTFQTVLTANVQRLGDIKPTSLETRFDWASIFSSAGAV